MSGIKEVVQQLQSQRRLAEREIGKLNLAIKALTSLEELVPAAVTTKRKPKLSAAARARIAAAQRARWAKVKAKKKAKG